LKKIAIFLGLVVLAAVVLGIGFAVNLYHAGRAHTGKPQYVALGSSFAAGPGITEREPGSPVVCARSNDNYAHLLARQRQLSLVDMSCSGATTKQVLEDGWMLQPAQISVVTAGTELVTVTIGGNDVSYMGNLVALGCDANTGRVVRFLGGCRVKTAEQLEKSFAALPNQLTRIAAEVHQRAPKARLVFVNYFTVLPESGTCERLGLSADAADQMRAVAKRLADITREVALSNHAELLDLASLSASHNDCAADPWLRGMHPEGGLLAAPLHPTLEGMQAVAAALNQLLNQPRAAQ
jgi:lysophospholipase L1-like esterase